MQGCCYQCYRKVFLSTAFRLSNEARSRAGSRAYHWGHQCQTHLAWFSFVQRTEGDANVVAKGGHGSRQGLGKLNRPSPTCYFGSWLKEPSGHRRVGHSTSTMHSMVQGMIPWEYLFGFPWLSLGRSKEAVYWCAS